MYIVIFNYTFELRYNLTTTETYIVIPKWTGLYFDLKSQFLLNKQQETDRKADRLEDRWAD